MSSTNNVKNVRTTVNSTLFNNDPVNLAYLLVKNTDGDAKRLNEAHECFLQAMGLVPDVLKELADAATLKANAANQRAQKLAQDLEQTSTELLQARELVASRMLKKLTDGGIPLEQAKERVQRELSGLNANLERVNTRLASVQAKKGTKAKQPKVSTSNTAAKGTLAQSSRTFHIQ